MAGRIHLVTGGAGFIGSHIVELLLSRGGRVRVFDNFSTGRRENLAGLAGPLEVIEGDVRDRAAIVRAAAGCAFLLHQAALPSVVRSVEDPVACHEVNVGGTLNALLAARDAGAERFVFASSSSVYGDAPVLPKEEGMRPMPRSPYAASKIAGEHYCAAFSAVFGLCCVSLRYFNVFGPRQDPSSPYAAVIPKFIAGSLGGGGIVIDGDGEQSRDFTFVRNVAAANLLACEAPLRGGEVLNIACGESTTINELLRLVQEVLGVSVPARRGAPRAGDVRHSVADIRRAGEVLGYAPSVGLREGLRLTAGAHRS
ncbi:MAG: SDR family oxidoreductase [bacterium]|nr:SDR family oxidoreductase [bacterium]